MWVNNHSLISISKLIALTVSNVIGQFISFNTWSVILIYLFL